jgi:hypothetical protein
MSENKRLISMGNHRPWYVHAILNIVSSLMILLLSTSPAFAGIFDDIRGEIKSCFGGGCDPSIVINKELKRKSFKISEGLSEPARIEFEKGINNVFDENIYPLLKQIDTVSHDRISQIGDVTNDVLDNAIGKAVNGMDKLFDDFAVIVQTFSPGEIQQKIILSTSAEISKISTQFFDQVNIILDRVDIFVDKLDCKAEGFSTAIKNDLTKIVNSFLPGNFLKQASCRKKLGISLLKPDFQLTNSEFYLLTRCLIEKQMSNNKNINIKQVAGYYFDIKGIANRMRCVERNNDGDF